MFWSESAISSSGGLLLLGACTLLQGSVVLSLAVIGYVVKVQVAGILSWQTPYDLSSSAISQELNEDVYARIRQTVIDKLGDRPKYMISDLAVVTPGGHDD